MLLTRFVTKQIQPFSTAFNCFQFNSIAVTNIQFNLFNFKAFSINSTILQPNHKFPQPQATCRSSVSLAQNVVHAEAAYKCYQQFMLFLAQCQMLELAHLYRSFTECNLVKRLISMGDNGSGHGVCFTPHIYLLTIAC